MTVINTNVGALTARNYALKAGESTNKAMERLSSGLRINSAADDAAGLAVANKMESQLRGMNVAIRNSQDGISLVQTAEAGMSEISNMVIRMRELSVQMNNGIYTATDRTNAQLEITALLAEVDKISANTAFNDVKVLDGTYSADIRAGNTNAEVINVTVERMNTDSLGGINLAGTKTVATADSSTDANKVGTTSFSSTEAESVTIKTADFGVGISGFSAANANGTYSLSGADAALFELDAANNIVSKAAVAFDTTANPKNSYALTVTYTDQIGVNSFAENLTLNITANQTLASVKSATSNLTTSESASVSFRATNSTGASDGILSSALQTFVSADTGSGTYSVTGTDAAQFTVDQNNGVITASLDFETKRDSGTNNVYDFNVVYTSSTGDKFTETVALTVTDSQEETVTFGSTVANTGFSAGTADVTVGDVFSVAVDGQTLNATITADDAAFTITKLANILNSENAQQATPARGTFSVSSGDIVWTFNDSVGNIDDSLRPGAITQVDKTVKAASVTTTAAAQVTDIDVGTAVTAETIVTGDVITLTVGGSTLTYTSAAGGETGAQVVAAFTAQDTTNLAFTLSQGANADDLKITMKDNGAVTATPTLTMSPQTGWNAAATGATTVTNAGRSDGREAVAKVTTYGGLGASLNAAVSTDTFDVTIGGTNISATVGAGVTSGTYGIASLVTDLNAANQALATPVAITFSASGGDLVATAVNANDDIAMTSAVQRNNGDVGSVTLTTRAAAAVSRTVDFAAPGVAAAVTDRIEVTVNGTTYSTANNLGGTAISDVITELNAATTVDADGNKLNALYTASVVGSDIRLTAVSAGAGANVDTFADLTYVLTGTVAISGGASTAQTDGVDTLVSVAASKVGSSVDGAATNTLFGNFSSQSSSFVTTAASSIAMQEASKLEFATDAMSAALNTYRTASGKTGGTFTISGGDSAKFSVDKSSGLVTNIADMDADTVSSYSFDVTYTDKAGGKFVEKVTLNLTNNVADDGTHLSDVDLTSQASSNTAISILDKAINQIASSQAKLGAIQNRLQHNIDNLSAASMLTETAKGRIVDADFARETTELSKQQILSQAATSMLAQANQSKQSVLALLQ